MTDMSYIEFLMDITNRGGPGSGKARAELKRITDEQPEPPPMCPAGIDASNDVRTTIAVSVTVKIDAHGATPEALLNHAIMSAMTLVEDGLGKVALAERDGHYVWATFSPGVGNVESTISVEGATALVNHAELEKMFEEQS